MAREVRLAGHLLFWALLSLAQPAQAAGDGGARDQPDFEAVVVKAKSVGDVPAGVLRALGDGMAIEAAIALHADHPAFGGLSGLWIAPDGADMITVSDTGLRWQARLSHDDSGRLTGVDDWSFADLPLRPEDWPRAAWLDAEALAGSEPNGLVVAYEAKHRLRRWSLNDLAAVPEALPLPHGLGPPSNSGIEALASLGAGRLFALAEKVGAPGGEGLMGWVIDSRIARDFIYIPGNGFSPTGADRLEETVYVVERRFSLFGGFSTRLVTVPVEAIRPGARIEGTELAAFRWGDIGENFEGVVARRGPDGRIFLYLLADDNFSFLQQTLLVQLSLSTEVPID